jgi:glycosyltransferase involved in cell wall biosynthesis
MLADALNSLSHLDADGFHFEIVVVDNGSTDGTPAVVAAANRGSAVAVRHVVESRAGVAFARNRGVKEAAGEWIAFFDDDQLADRRWLVELLAMAREKNVRCVGGAVDLKLPAGHTRILSPVIRMLLGETVGMDEPRKYNANVTPGTGNLIVHRSVFNEVGIFNEELNVRGEDTDLFLRIFNRGFESWYTPAALVHHVIPPERLQREYLCRLAKIMAGGMAEIDRDDWGKALYPFAWLARCAQAALLLVPRLLWALLRRDEEKALGAYCRLSIARKYLAEGFELIVGGLVGPFRTPPREQQLAT